MAISHFLGTAVSTVSHLLGAAKANVSAVLGATTGFGGSSGAGPIPAFRAAGAGAAGSGSIVPGLPAGTALNDILVLITESNPSEPVTAPAGWTDIGVPTGNGASQLGVFWKRAGSSESAPTVADSGNHTNAIILGFSGCITTGNPWNASQSNTNILNGGTATAANRISGITTTVNNCLIVGAVTGNSSTAGAYFSSWSAIALSSVTERADYDGSGGTIRHIGAVTGGLATAGATGNIVNATANTSNFGGQFLGALMAP